MCIRDSTSDPDIYAVGDAVEVVNPVTGAPALVALAGPAACHVILSLTKMEKRIKFNKTNHKGGSHEGSCCI